MPLQVLTNEIDPVRKSYARAYLSDHPDVRLTYRRDLATVALARASDDPDLVRPLPIWQEKLQLFRAVDGGAPERCAPTFGAAT